MKGPNCCGCIKTQFHFDIEFRRGTRLSHNPENLPDGALGRNRCVCFLGQSSRVLLYLLWPLSVLTREAQVTGLGASGHPLLALGSWWPHAGSGPGSLLHSGGALQGPFGFGFAVLPAQAPGTRLCLDPLAALLPAVIVTIYSSSFPPVSCGGSRGSPKTLPRPTLT